MDELLSNDMYTVYPGSLKKHGTPKLVVWVDVFSIGEKEAF